MATFARAVRRMQIEALELVLQDYGIDRDVFPPALVAAGIQGLAFAMVHDQVAGFETAHEEASTAMARLVDRLEKRGRRRMVAITPGGQRKTPGLA